MNKKLSLQEAQENLPELVSELEHSGGYVEVVKNKHTAAVMITLSAFRKLQQQNPELFLKKKPNTEWKLRGSVELIGDIEEASREISKQILESIDKQKL
ncbi:MAG: hypothetical protein ACE5IR_05665 [bacterium]